MQSVQKLDDGPPIIPVGYPAFIGDPAFIRTIDLDPRRLFETRGLIKTRRLFGDLRYQSYGGNFLNILMSFVRFHVPF